MKLYHGTNYSSAVSICSNGIDLRYSKPYLDFGPGFYATPSYHHAALTAVRRTDKINQWNRRKQKDYKFEEPYIVQFEYIPLPELELKLIAFPRHGAEWGAFVLNNRLTSEILSQYGIENHNQDCRYDICIGEIADGIFHKGIGVNITDRSSMPHVTCVKVTPDQKSVCAVDSGLDQVKIVEYCFRKT